MSENLRGDFFDSHCMYAKNIEMNTIKNVSAVQPLKLTDIKRKRNRQELISLMYLLWPFSSLAHVSTIDPAMTTMSDTQLAHVSTIDPAATTTSDTQLAHVSTIDPAATTMSDTQHLVVTTTLWKLPRRKWVMKYGGQSPQLGTWAKPSRGLKHLLPFFHN